ncbi:hypothetical protein ABL385_004694, partial [Escherichia coli]
VEYNMAQSAVYRVCGGKLYKGESEVGDVAGSGRVSMAHGRTSQAVGVNGQLVEYRYDGTVKTVSNWPTDSGFTQYELGSVRDITRLRGRYAWSKDGTDSWFITDLEHLLFTPLFKADNARVFDFEVESSTGVAQYADRLFLSATTDGINYGREQMIEQNEPFVYDKRVLWKKVGRIRKNIGFKLRVITKSPVTLSGCQIRIE